MRQKLTQQNEVGGLFDCTFRYLVAGEELAGKISGRRA